MLFLSDVYGKKWGQLTLRHWTQYWENSQWETQQNSVIVHPFRAATSNKNSNQCERKTNLDIFVSKTQGTISRKFFVMHTTKFRGNYRHAPNTISEQLSTRHTINYEQFHITPLPMLSPAVTEKYRDNSPRVAPKKNQCNCPCGVIQTIEKMQCKESEQISKNLLSTKNFSAFGRSTNIIINDRWEAKIISRIFFVRHTRKIMAIHKYNIQLVWIWCTHNKYNTIQYNTYLRNT